MKSRPPPSPPLEEDEFLSDESRLTLAILQDNLMLTDKLFQQGVRPEEIADRNDEPGLIDVIAMGGSAAMLKLMLAHGETVDRRTLVRAAIWEATPERHQFLCRLLNVSPSVRRRLKRAKTPDERWLVIHDWYRN